MVHTRYETKMVVDVYEVVQPRLVCEAKSLVKHRSQFNTSVPG